MIHNKEIQTRVSNAINSGVQPWSQPMHCEDYYVFASDMLDTNVVHLLNERGVKYKDMIGSYVMQSTGERIQETSFIINANDIGSVMDIIENQESVLFLTDNAPNGMRHAFLMFIGSLEPRQYLGQLKNVPEEVARAQQNWTYCPYSEKHFITTMDTEEAKTMAYTLENLPIRGD